jgi:hypothetical protein
MGFQNIDNGNVVYGFKIMPLNEARRVFLFGYLFNVACPNLQIFVVFMRVGLMSGGYKLVEQTVKHIYYSAWHVAVKC